MGLRKLNVALKVTRQKLLAGGLMAIGFGLTVYLGVLSGADRQPSRATSALLVVLAGVFQIAGAGQFNKLGRADPGLARAAVRRILKMVVRTRESRKLAESTYDLGTAQEVRKTLGRISVELSWVEEGLLDAIGDWNEFHAEALQNITKGAGNAGSN